MVSFSKTEVKIAHRVPFLAWPQRVEDYSLLYLGLPPNLTQDGCSSSWISPIWPGRAAGGLLGVFRRSGSLLLRLRHCTPYAAKELGLILSR